MKQRKTIAVLSLLLALSISLPACGGGAAEPSPSSESEEAPYSEETSDTTSAAELSDEQREALDDWIWYERGTTPRKTDTTLRPTARWRCTPSTAPPRTPTPPTPCWDAPTTLRALTSARTMCLS